MQKQLEDRAYANFFIRLSAFLVDSIVAFLLAMIVRIPLFIADLMGAEFLSANFIFEYSITDIVSYISVVLYFSLMTFYSHTTVGKMLYGLEVITEDKEWSFINILYRETIGRFLSSLLMLGYLFILARENHQGLHDILCDTYVVYKKLVPKPQMISSEKEIVEVLSVDEQPLEAQQGDIQKVEEQQEEVQ